MTQDISKLPPIKKYFLLAKYYGRNPTRGLIYWGGEPISIEDIDRYSKILSEMDIRLKILEDLIRGGIPPDVIADAIDWKGFEELVSQIFMLYGYKVDKNVRFKRFEYDILAFKEDILFSIDCKHWDRIIYPSMAEKIVDSLIRRTVKLDMLPKYRGYRKYGLVVTLVEGGVLKHRGIYFIPIYYLKNFLEEVYTLIFEGELKEI